MRLATSLLIVCAAPLAALADEPAAVTKSAETRPEGLTFGSYGRVGAGTDLDGSSPESVNVVTHGSRVVEPTYLELDLYYDIKTKSDTELTTVTTLAFGDRLFHFDGQFDSALALRNFYLEARRDDVGVWAGSRMVRGDDIYLLDFWPLDDLNIVGGGAFMRRGRADGGVAVGVNRLLDPFQFQERELGTPGMIGAEPVPQLDRQRLVASVKGSYRLLDPSGGLGLKLEGYGEVQGLPRGERRREDQTVETLPADFGWRAGLELGAWGFARGASHANLFVRFSQGLAAFDELAVPTGLSADKKAFPGATELLIGWSGNLELGRAGLMAGGYSRRFVDADPNTQDRDDGWEYIAEARPWLTLYGPLAAAVDASFQARMPRGISPTTLMAMDPAVFQVAPMLLYSPFGEGSYARPQFRLAYRAAHLNDGARDLYPLGDPRRGRDWVHYVGFQAEWWFNSTYR